MIFVFHARILASHLLGSVQIGYTVLGPGFCFIFVCARYFSSFFFKCFPKFFCESQSSIYATYHAVALEKVS